MRTRAAIVLLVFGLVVPFGANPHQSKFTVTGLTDAQIASFLTALQHAIATHNIARIVSLTVFPVNRL